jgi:acyl dehydratase
VLTDWFGPTALRRLQVRFSKQVWPDETLTCTATVTGLREEGGDGLVDVECQVANRDGEVKLTGTATAVAPKGDR